MDLVSALAIHASTPIPAGLETPCSVAGRFFAGARFEGVCKRQDAEAKTAVAVVERLNGVIRACGAIAKTIARAAGRQQR